MFMDDMRANMQAVYRDALGFLGLMDDERTDFPAMNTRTRVKNLLWQRIMIHSYHMLQPLRTITQALNIHPYRFLRAANLQTETAKTALPAAFRAELTKVFVDDIALLSTITGRDLSSWLKDES